MHTPVQRPRPQVFYMYKKRKESSIHTANQGPVQVCTVGSALVQAFLHHVSGHGF